MQGKFWGFDIKILIPGRFSFAKGRAKNMVLTSCLSPGGGYYSRAMKTEIISPAGRALVKMAGA